MLLSFLRYSALTSSVILHINSVIGQFPDLLCALNESPRTLQLNSAELFIIYVSQHTNSELYTALVLSSISSLIRF